MLFSVKKSTICQRNISSLAPWVCGIALVATVAVIGWPKMAYFDVKKFTKINVLNRFDSFLCYKAANMYGYICLAGSRKFVCSVVIWERDSAWFFI